MTARSVIPYEKARLNIGNGMNLATGVFTAPVNGRYQFNFVAKADAAIYTDVFLRVNGINIAYGIGISRYDNPVITATLALKKNDRIDTWMNQGSIFDRMNGESQTQFTGILLEEDLVF